MNRCIALVNLWMLFCAVGFSQTIVSTQQQNKTAVLEYFGGMYCGYCPEADDIAMQLEASWEGQIAIINVQTGYFAIPDNNHPDLRTNWGYALDQLAGNGLYYPAGTINRHHFPGLELVAPGTTAMGRNVWEYATHQISEQISPVNLAVEAELDPVSNNINIYLEYYYTANCISDTNYLHVALLQNGVEAPQLLEDQTIDQNYIHDYLLRDLITPQWGSPITNTSSGSFESRVFTYALPANFRDIMVDINQLEIVAFISVDQQEILSGVSEPVMISPPAHEIDVNLWAANLEQNICNEQLQPNVIIRNDGIETLTDITFEYSVNNGALHTHQWSGALHSHEATNVVLPSINFDAQYSIINTLQVQITTPNDLAEDANLSNNILHTTIDDVPSAPTPTITLELKTDDYGFETYWEILDSDGNLVIAGGNQNVGASGGGQQIATDNDPGAYSSNELIIQSIELPAFDCYEFRILDDYADGICCKYGVGYYRIKDENGNLLFYGGHFDIEKSSAFRIGAVATAQREETPSEIKVYPNPVSADLVSLQFNATQSGNANISLFDANGRQVLDQIQQHLNTGQYNWDISTNGLSNGMYILQLQFEDKIFTEKLVILRN